MGLDITLHAESLANSYFLSWEDPSSGQVQEREISPGEELNIGRFEDLPGPNYIHLDHPLVSRAHAKVSMKDGILTILDKGSTNGTWVNGEKIEQDREIELAAGDSIRIARFTLKVSLASVKSDFTPFDLEKTIYDNRGTAVSSVSRRGLEEIIREPIVSVEELSKVVSEVKEKTFATLGGGLGSFIWVDILRNSGVPKDDILVFGDEETPYAHFKSLCLNSQLTEHERLRSHSEACPDNIWGFPGYALREAWPGRFGGGFKNSIGVLWKIFGEPVIAETYAPKASLVFRAIDREVRRIGWKEMFTKGRIRAVRKSNDGRLVAILSQGDQSNRKDIAVCARYMHIALGHPAAQLSPNLAEYREKYQDRQRVVNAFERHQHIYEQLHERGGTVLILGQDIVASRLIERLSWERGNDSNIEIVHLHRSQLDRVGRYGHSRRATEHEFEFQPLSWPKGTWGGEQRFTLEKANIDTRNQLLAELGGVTTTKRRDWRKIIQEGLRDRWYRVEFGSVQEVRPHSNGQIMAVLDSSRPGGGIIELPTDFIIDCRGTNSNPSRNPLLGDMIEIYDDVRANENGYVAVTNDFEIEGMRNNTSRMFMSGIATSGGAYAPVDSFLGLQYSALKSIDFVLKTADRPLNLRKLNGIYSFRRWVRWARGVAP